MPVLLVAANKPVFKLSYKMCLIANTLAQPDNSNPFSTKTALTFILFARFAKAFHTPVYIFLIVIGNLVSFIQYLIHFTYLVINNGYLPVSLSIILFEQCSGTFRNPLMANV